MSCHLMPRSAAPVVQSEITVLSKLRHRHLVNLIGYCMDGYERLLVYEFMPKVPIMAKHCTLFSHWIENSCVDLVT